jgi:hypothetical protein
MHQVLSKVLCAIPFLVLCPKLLAGQLTVAADLIQPFILGGWNLNSYYYFDNNLVLGWSHGDDLRISHEDSFAPPPVKDSRSKVLTDWSTGPEVGYRLGKYWDTRMDFKAHYNRLKFDSNPMPLRYTVYTVGPSIFYNWFPFSSEPNGFLVQFSARYWFQVGDDFKKDGFTYTDKQGRTKNHDPKTYWDGGISGFGANVAFGWAM